MLVVYQNACEALANALLHALNLGVEQGLIDQLRYLNEYGAPPGRVDYSMCELYKDFAPYSLTFSLWMAKMTDDVDPDTGCRKPEKGDDGESVFDGNQPPFLHGGLIYHPPAGEPDQSLSVEISPRSEPHWSIHT